MDDYECFVGIDWASRSHQVCVTGKGGEHPQQREFSHSHDGLSRMVSWLLEHCAYPGGVAVAIEVPHGPVVELLVEQGLAVFSINPKQLDRFRDRHSVAGAKDDRRDAFVLADALRTDLHKFTRVLVPDATTIQLREASRCFDELTTDIRRASSRLREQLQRFAPHLLQMCHAADEPWFWDVVEFAADPGKARGIRRDRVAGLLARHRKRAVTVEEVLEAARTPALTVAPGAIAAALQHIKILLPQLRLFHDELVRCRARLAELNREAGRIAEILVSHPGIAVVIAATLLSEVPQALAEADLPRMRVLAGTAPVTKQSGRHRTVGMRRACNHRVRQAMRQWAFTAVRYDPYAKELYQRLRQRGHRHERALRGVGDRLLTCLAATLRDDALYDPLLRNRHLNLDPVTP